MQQLQEEEHQTNKHQTNEYEVNDRLERETAEAQNVKNAEISQILCDACKLPLVSSIRLVACRCALCGCCVENTVQYTRQCPVCDTVIATKQGKPVPDAGELSTRVEERIALYKCAVLEKEQSQSQHQHQLQERLASHQPSPRATPTSRRQPQQQPAHQTRPTQKNDIVDEGWQNSTPSPHQIVQQLETLARLKQQRKNSLRIVIEFGNTVKQVGSQKVNYKTFLKQ